MFADDGSTEDYFGSSVSVYSTTAMIGAFGDDDKDYDAGITKDFCFVFKF
jgi:hypothetical protein